MTQNIILDILTLPFICLTDTVKCTPFSIKIFFTLQAMAVLASVTNWTCYNQLKDIQFHSLVNMHFGLCVEFEVQSLLMSLINGKPCIRCRRLHVCVSLLCSLMDIVIKKNQFLSFSTLILNPKLFND